MVGPFGLLQPMADGIKLVFKETVIPTGANSGVFMIAPLITFVLALVAWGGDPVQRRLGRGRYQCRRALSLRDQLAWSLRHHHAGWASNSKYAFLGAMRSAAQMVSYEVSIGFVIVTVLLCAGSLNLTKIVMAQQTVWFIVPLLPMAVVFFISGLAETNRSPFDLPEGESELVGGFFVEYSSMAFALFYLGEYMNMI